MKAKILFTLILFSSSTVLLNAQKKERGEVEDFEGIALSVDAKVYVKQGPQRLLEIEAPESVLEQIETYVRGEKLVIKSKNWNLRTRETIKIWIVNPEIKSLTVSGSGDIYVDGELETEELSMAVSGSGGIMIKVLAAEEIEADIAGSGKINLAGNADEMEISISGSGTIDAGGLKVSEAEVAISGSGSGKVFVIDELGVAVSGSGNVYYKGNPRIDASISGSGKVKELDD